MLLRRSFCSNQTRSFFSVSSITMPSVKRLVERQHIALKPDELFEVVADVERYKEFLPFCADSRIRHRISKDCFEAELKIGFQALTAAYTSRVTLMRPSEMARDKATSEHRIQAEVVKSTVFSEMNSEWRFSPRSDGSTDVEFRIQFQALPLTCPTTTTPGVPFFRCCPASPLRGAQTVCESI